MYEDRIATFVQSLATDQDPIIEAIEQEALASGVPIIRPECQGFLKVLLAIHKPMRILEIGTAVGFSAVLMASALEGKCHIDTIENYPPRIPIARTNFARTGLSEQIHLHEGDALEVLMQMAKKRAEQSGQSMLYDFVFLDAAKGQYPAYLPYILELMAPGAVLVTDNILQEGELLESRFAILKRNRTIHDRMREFLYTLTHTEGLKTSILGAADGLAVSVKIRKHD